LNLLYVVLNKEWKIEYKVGQAYNTTTDTNEAVNWAPVKNP